MSKISKSRNHPFFYLFWEGSGDLKKKDILETNYLKKSS